MGCVVFDGENEKRQFEFLKRKCEGSVGVLWGEGGRTDSNGNTIINPHKAFILEAR